MNLDTHVKLEEMKRSIYEFLVRSGTPGIEMLEDESLNIMMRDFVAIDENLKSIDNEEGRIVYMKDVICRLFATIHIQQKLLNEGLEEE